MKNHRDNKGQLDKSQINQQILNKVDKNIYLKKHNKLRNFKIDHYDTFDGDIEPKTSVNKNRESLVPLLFLNDKHNTSNETRINNFRTTQVI